jgi:hypothetical protein
MSLISKSARVLANHRVTRKSPQTRGGRVFRELTLERRRFTASTAGGSPIEAENPLTANLDGLTVS